MESEPARLIYFWIMVLEGETRLWKEIGNHTLIPINNFKFVSKKKGKGVERDLDSEFASSNCMARNNFQIWDAKKLWGHVPWCGFCTQSQQVRSNKWSQLILRPTCVFGPRTEIGGRGEALNALIPAAPICSHGAKTDHKFYWANFLQTILFWNRREEEKTSWSSPKTAARQR